MSWLWFTVPDGDIHAEYKQVTVLFADVVRSVDIGAALDMERLREIKVCPDLPPG